MSGLDLNPTCTHLRSFAPTGDCVICSAPEAAAPATFRAPEPDRAPGAAPVTPSAPADAGAAVVVEAAAASVKKPRKPRAKKDPAPAAPPPVAPPGLSSALGRWRFFQWANVSESLSSYLAERHAAEWAEYVTRGLADQAGRCLARLLAAGWVRAADAPTPVHADLEACTAMLIAIDNSEAGHSAPSATAGSLAVEAGVPAASTSTPAVPLSDGPHNQPGTGSAPAAGSSLSPGAPAGNQPVPMAGAPSLAEEIESALVEREIAVDATAAVTSLDDGRAGWLMRRLVENEAQLARLAEQYASICRAIRGDSRSLVFRFGPMLKDWAAGQLRGKTRSVKTLDGTAAFRTVKGGPRVANKAALTPWAEAQDDPTKFGEYAYALSWSKVKAHILATGEAPPGVEILEDRETFTISAGDVKVDVSALAASGPPEPEPGETEANQQMEGDLS